jgi:hypothetical protein
MNSRVRPFPEALEGLTIRSQFRHSAKALAGTRGGFGVPLRLGSLAGVGCQVANVRVAI